MLDLLETLLARYGIQNLRYDGKMRSEAREAALAGFRKTSGPKVILISTKCGGVGLNLTIANRVIKCACFRSLIPYATGLSLTHEM